MELILIKFIKVGACAVALLLPAFAIGQSQITFAGVAFSGDAQSIRERFKYSMQYEDTLKKGESYAKVKAAIEQAPPKNFEIATQIDELKGRDQALVVSLVVTSETVSVEEFGQLRKLLVNIGGQALFFDFKSMTVVRSYPLRFAYIDVFDRAPTEAEVLERVRRIYEGTPTRPGIYGRFVSALGTAVLPKGVPRFLQVSKVTLSGDLVNELPPALKSSQTVAETWAADLVSEAISNRVGVPIIPYTKGYAIGNVMSMRVLDGTVYTLTLPKPDFEISVDFTGIKKMKYAEAPSGASFIYGAFATIKIQEPVSGTVYLNTALKNGEVKVVPASQNYVHDFPAYNDTVNGLFLKLADAVSGKGNAWVKSASESADIESQILKTRELMNICK